VGYWQAALAVWFEQPLTGYGFGAGGRYVAFQNIGGVISNLHSGVMELLSGLGILGVLPLAYAVARVGRWSYGLLRGRSELELGILVVPLLLHSTVANGIAGWLTADVVVFACLVALSDLESTSSQPLPAETSLLSVR
jgi:O-antigen ligase